MQLKSNSITPDQIKTGNYQQIQILDFDQIIPFVRKQMEEPNRITQLYSFFQLIFFLFLLGIAVYKVINGYTIGNAVANIGYGILFTFLLIPLHEALHGLAYFLLGARKISYSANFRKFYFTAQADHFVVDEKGFYWVAFTPFAVVALLSLSVGFIWPILLLPAAAVLMMHTMFCGGDFALAAFFFRHHDEGLLTYDDVKAKRAYFYLPANRPH